ncbi:hypothetical protein, conserved [Leishmania tarentolae]|uniref:Uncharacterized protein n=1 Tax=Leishmania tarentolae TaxID=5689 RepID=A0A640KJJ7_LEITA|nr:hypothetical protein, conserved [Leishmania tarentolae]
MGIQGLSLSFPSTHAHTHTRDNDFPCGGGCCISSFLGSTHVQMWSQTLCRRWITRSPLCLRGTIRAGGEDQQALKASGNASPAHGAARASHLATEATRTGTVPSAPPEVVAPVPSSTLSAITQAVDQLREFTRRTQHTLRTQEETIRLMQQELLLLTRRVAQLESTADNLHGKLNEVHCAIGEVVLLQRNTDLLVQQMERRHLAGSACTQAETGSGKGESVAQSAAVPLSDTCGSLSASHNSGATLAAARNAATTMAPSALPTNAQLAEQVATLHARLDQITTNIFAADRLGVAIDRMAAHGVEKEKIAASILPADNPLSRASLLQRLQKRHALGTFTDAAGVTRLSSQVVRVHNVPLNMGAMEVRELCVQHVCKGNNADELVSCMVHRSTDSIPAAAVESSHARNPVEEGTDSPTDAALPQYLSRASASKPSSSSLASADAAALGTLPRGDNVAAIRPNTKTLEVVFTSAAAALRALQVLNGMHLRSTLHETPLPLVVEPVVSADVLAALKAWEDEAAAATPHLTK